MNNGDICIYADAAAVYAYTAYACTSRKDHYIKMSEKLIQLLKEA